MQAQPINNNIYTKKPIKTYNNYEPQNNQSFKGLRKVVRCKFAPFQEVPCSSLEKTVIKELRDLAKVDNFFIENDVKARVMIERHQGARIWLDSKPAPKNIFERIRNLFLPPTTYHMVDKHPCPDDSAFCIAKKLRNIKDKKETFLSCFKKMPQY